MSPNGETTGRGRAAAPSAHRSPSAYSAPGAHHTATPLAESAAVRATPADQEIPGQTQIPALSPTVLRAELAGAAHAPPTMAPEAELVARTATQSPDDSLPPNGAERWRVPESWKNRPGETPAEVAWTMGPTPVTGDVGVSVPPGGGNAGAPPRTAEPEGVRDLLPPSVSTPLPVETLGPGGSSRRPRSEPHNRVSIGTIEVTVVPPPPPAPAREVKPPVQAAHDMPRPPSLLAVSTGADRLRDGLRRWYGTAQG
jgi:hypothetical protein